MPKRKDPTEDTPMGGTEDAGSDSDSDVSLVNVDFEMFDPQPTHDFHGIRQLLRQLFDSDNTLFDLTATTELILSQPLLGTTVKTDGNESDAFAFLTVLNLSQHKEHPGVAPIAAYLSKHANPTIRAVLNDAKNTVGLILTERLINMPPAIVPPMYKMLGEEMEWAVQEGEPYEFTHFVVVSKTYAEVASLLDDETNPTKKKGKWGAMAAKKKKNEEQVFYYHPEDEIVVQRLGEKKVCGWKYENAGGAADSKRAFSDMGIVPKGMMMLIPKEEFDGVVGDLEGLFK